MKSQKTFAIGPMEALMVMGNAARWPIDNGRRDKGHPAHWRRGLDSVDYYKPNPSGAAFFFGTVRMSSIYDEGCVCDIVVVSKLPEDAEFLRKEFMKLTENLVEVANGHS